MYCREKASKGSKTPYLISGNVSVTNYAFKNSAVAGWP